MDNEYVNVLVPRKHLAKVYGYVASLEGEDGSDSPSSAVTLTPRSEEPEMDEWTNSRLRRLVDESPPAMLDILHTLSSRAGEWLTSEDLAAAIRHKPDADWNTVAGTLGAFGRRIKNRYGLESWPFENKHDHELGGRVFVMNDAMAARIMPLVDGLRTS